MKIKCNCEKLLGILAKTDFNVFFNLPIELKSELLKMRQKEMQRISKKKTRKNKISHIPIGEQIRDRVWKKIEDEISYCEFEEPLGTDASPDVVADSPLKSAKKHKNK